MGTPRTYETSMEGTVQTHEVTTGAAVRAREINTGRRSRLSLGVVLALNVACGDSTNGSTTGEMSTGQSTETGTQTDGPMTAGTNPDMTTTGTGNMTEGGGSMSAGSVSTTELTTGTTVTTGTDTGDKCEVDEECGDYSTCVDNVCKCNENHTGEKCESCVEGTILTTLNGCVDNPCDNNPNPCGDQSCIPNEENGNPNCSSPAPVISNLEVKCDDGPTMDTCLAGQNTYEGSFTVTDAENCNLNTLKGIVDPGLVVPINEKGSFTYYSTADAFTDTITVNCTGKGGPSAPAQVVVENK